MSDPKIQQAGLELFHPAISRWFAEAFDGPTDAQSLAWPAIARRENTLLLAPTGSGKTLAAFLVAINRIMFPGAEDRASADRQGVRVLYISPLKALGVDVERNLRAPIAGVRGVASRDGVEHHVPQVGVRTGDTPSAERARLVKDPPEILITTPESLYLLLTSQARKILLDVNTVIVDEIHSVASTKRGSHLFVSLERLEAFRKQSDPDCAPLQRIGLSATQRPLDEIARLLGGADATPDPESAPQPRPVTIVQAPRRKALELKIEVPVEDMARMGQADLRGPEADGPTLPSIWPSIHPRLVELIREHRSTMIFVNSRRLAERLAAAINESAEEEIALAHHGSIARQTRLQVEDRLKRGTLPAIVATSSLELGIDMGAVDLVIQIEAPPSIASGIQRIGRAGHQVDAVSSGIVFPKYRGDLLAASAAARRMMDGQVEETYYPRNPLDVLAQQLVAMVALEKAAVDDMYATVRSAAPFHELPRGSFEGVLDLLAGRYPSDEFSELRPRLTWDRVAGEASPRKGTQRIAVLNGGTIPDRGLYGVYLSDDSGGSNRVGELDEEMVFETYVGDVFLLGASSWRVLDITNDRMIVAPAPGEPGKMPFWHGDRPGRPLEFGMAIGQLARSLMGLPREQAETQLTTEHGLDDLAARNLLNYLHDQAEATEEVPSDTTLIVECFLDEVGDWRIAILSPFGARVHAPWATAVAARLRQESSGEVDVMWTDDGLVFRLPESDDPPPLEWLFPSADDIEDMVTSQLNTSAVFASHFRENAARALLLPKRHPGKRTPLWLQRRRAADLLGVASQYPAFPILLETYRECLRDVFDLKGLKQVLRDVERRVIRVRMIRTHVASPFAASLLFNYVGNFIYDGDAPLAERRAQTLALDHAQLRELLGDAELRELLDADAIDELAIELQRLRPEERIRHADALHERLLLIGDLSRDELAARCAPETISDGHLDRWCNELADARRIIQVRIAGEMRYAAAEDAARLRDALGVSPPAGLPDAFLESVPDALGDLVSRYARTHVPFKADDAAARFGLGISPIRMALDRLASQNRVLEGEFLPGGRGREWCDTQVLRTLKRRSLARLRKQIEPVAPARFANFLVGWQGVAEPRRGLDTLLDTIQQLQGLALPASTLERDILPARVKDYEPAQLDELCAAGEVVWRGCGSLGAADGRVALYLTDHLCRLMPPATTLEDELRVAIHELLAKQGALFFEDIVRAVGGFRNDILDALWDMVWAGDVTNDTLAPLRSLMRNQQKTNTRTRRIGRGFRSRRLNKTPGSEGRWSLLLRPDVQWPTATERQAAIAAQLIDRYGVLTREAVSSEGIAGGFAGLYPVLKAMEEAGKVRRGYFVAGQGAAQFAAPGAEERLREKKDSETPAEIRLLAATDPANPYGAALKWPDRAKTEAKPQRTAGARVILRDGELLAYLGKTGTSLLTFLPETSPERDHAIQALVHALSDLAAPGAPVFLAKIDSLPAGESDLAAHLRAAGFNPTSRGYQLRGV